MTIALRAATAELRSLTLVCLDVTAALGIVFLACKGLEYREDLKEHLFPGRFSRCRRQQPKFSGDSIGS